MYRTIIVLTLLFLSMPTFAELKSLDSLYQESEKLLAEAMGTKGFTERSKSILKLEKIFTDTLNAYEKKYPKKGNKKEEDIALLYYTLEPAFELAHQKTISEKDCANKKQTVLTNDSMGRGESPPFTKPAKEALLWIELLCRKN